MVELAREIPGFLGIESYRDADRWGSSISYWKSEDDIKTWKAQIEHLEAQEKGRESWYERYQLRVSKVERAYAWSREAGYLQSENEE
jgi:heme-degrading monooxygenase HmoA